jgi:DNA-binding response OmpR family regulator
VPIGDDVAYDFENKQLLHGEKHIVMTHKEIEFFEILLAHRGNLVTKQEIEEAIYVYEEAPPSALKNLVFKLRKKLPNDLIETVGKLGYVIK